MLVMLAFVIALAVLGPLFGSDSRDGLDWTSDNFWLRRLSRTGRVRKSDSPAPACAGRASADACRTIPAAG